jgi:hypothetical protein
MSNSSSSSNITLSPSTEIINYKIPLSQQPEPYNLPIIGKEYIYNGIVNGKTDIGKFLYYNIGPDDNAEKNPTSYTLNMLFENNVIPKTYDFKNYKITPQITDFFDRAKQEDQQLSFLSRIFLSEKINPVYDAMINEFKFEGKAYGSKGYSVKGGGLSRKTNRKNKKNSKSKKTKSNRNKK